MERVESSGSGARNRKIHRIWVEGYDTSFEHNDLKRLLLRHFSSCGNVTHVHIPIASAEFLNRFAFLYIQGKGALKNALQLNGSTVGGDGGWIVTVKRFPFRKKYSGPDLEALTVAFPPPAPGLSRCAHLTVTGYDTSLSKSVVCNAIGHYFSSCGYVSRVCPSDIPGLINLFFSGGNVAFDKALRLSGRDYLGWNFVLYKVVPPTIPPRRSNWNRSPTSRPHSCLQHKEIMQALHEETQECEMPPSPFPINIRK